VVIQLWRVIKGVIKDVCVADAAGSNSIKMRTQVSSVSLLKGQGEHTQGMACPAEMACTAQGSTRGPTAGGPTAGDHHHQAWNRNTLAHYYFAQFESDLWQVAGGL
jgi:hypothetical protein